MIAHFLLVSAAKQLTKAGRAHPGTVARWLLLELANDALDISGKLEQAELMRR
jgi:hypothetical protein